jgi:hypothetical protein
MPKATAKQKKQTQSKSGIAIDPLDSAEDRALSPPKPGSVLQEILDQARAARASQLAFLAVFDLDSTLFDLTLRQAEIATAFSEHPSFRTAFPAECRELEKIEVRLTDWGLQDSLARLSLHASTHAEFHAALGEFWRESFFSDAYLHHDRPVAGAVEYVKALHAEAADILYLTGRDIGRMKAGTEASLRAHGFPLGIPQVRLLLKPSVALDDAAFKVAVLKETQTQYENGKIWLFENEPVNLNLVAKRCPEINLVFFESTHSGVEQAHPSFARIQSFEFAGAAQFKGAANENPKSEARTKSKRQRSSD